MLWFGGKGLTFPSKVNVPATPPSPLPQPSVSPLHLPLGLDHKGSRCVLPHLGRKLPKSVQPVMTIPRFTLSLVAYEEAKAVARGWGQRWKGLTVNGQEGFYWGNRNIRKLIYGYSCTIW